MEKLDKVIGNKLKQLRDEHKYTQREAADLAGMDHTYISKIENGKIPSVDKLMKLCSLYGVTLASLVGQETKTPKELKEIGVEWVSFADRMKDKNLTPEKIEKIVDFIEKIKE